MFAFSRPSRGDDANVGGIDADFMIRVDDYDQHPVRRPAQRHPAFLVLAVILVPNGRGKRVVERSGGLFERDAVLVPVAPCLDWVPGDVKPEHACVDKQASGQRQAAALASAAGSGSSRCVKKTAKSTSTSAAQTAGMSQIDSH